MVHTVKDKRDFISKLDDAGDHLVVVDFYATWCGPCKMIAPKFDELADEYPEVTFLKVDVDECEDLAVEYEISAMPTFVFIRNKKKLESFSGANTNKLQAALVRLK
ncbi:thioredoxin-2-like [Anabrus simplex]|uniref:thioredoxin-2-like n=1 Tax=Anabrus simplex TaxID=316456 RepID=UPI0034DCEF28